jgi:hypothetical protein
MKRSSIRQFVTTFFLFTFLVSNSVIAEPDASLKLHYQFGPLVNGKVQDVTGNGFDATLMNKASVRQINAVGLLELGTANGYLDLGTATGTLIASLTDFSISTFLFIDPTTDISGNGNFVWAFSTQDACTATTGKYIAYRVNAQRYEQAAGGWNNELVIVTQGSAAKKGQWTHVCYTQSGNTGTLYINGEAVKSGNATINPSAIGAPTTFNCLGRPPFDGDNYLQKTTIADFRIYNRALTASEVVQQMKGFSGVVSATAQEAMHAAVDTFQLRGFEAIRSNVRLPQGLNSMVRVQWVSSDPHALSSMGFVNRPAFGESAKKVSLKALFICGNDSVTKTFMATVLPYESNEVSVRNDLDALTFPADLKALQRNLSLPVKGNEGTAFTWSSSDTNFLSSAGEIKNLPAKGKGAKSILLKVTGKKGTATDSRTFNVSIPEDEGFSAYLFVYFTGNSGDQEAVRFALSSDGLTYKALNNNRPIISSDTIAQMKGVRDPHIYRGPDNMFYMVVTDMKASMGWSNNHAMVLLKSSDLVHWTHSIVDIAAQYPKYKDVNRVWAPQTIWDPTVGKFMIYWSQRSFNEKDVFYYAYANASFTGLDSEPKVLFTYPSSTIDGDIIVRNGQFNLFFKTEGNGNGIKKAEAASLTGPYVVKEDKYLQQTTQAVEGACVFKLINSDTYVLMYDVYANGKYEFTSSTDFSNFKVLNGVSMNFQPRHGTVIPITSEEAKRLAAKWGISKDLTAITSGSAAVKKLNIDVNEADQSIFLPVKPGTSLKAFDPKLNSLPGAIVKPAGAQDFSKGAVNYTFQLNDTILTYSVKAAVNRNPVLDGYYADPEILYAEKTGKFYLYPTSDGFPGWSGTYFKCFSSDNLETWKDEGVIVQLGKDVTWASANAWAPCIVEKKINGEYRYFYYFCAKQQIGVAVSDNPTGPFIDSGRPIINFKPAGQRGGQEIDPDVFTDPVSGKSYLYWGNGYMAGVELNDDMTSVKTETMKVLTPDRTFREAVYVIFRNGTYYFMWSEDDTGSPNYKVRYATATSPLGPLTIPAENIVIARDDKQAIYGTGHNSVLQLPGKDEWYIVYHRLTRPKGIKMSSPGYYREVCIDKLEFNADGSIKRAKPTLEGVAPVQIIKK